MEKDYLHLQTVLLGNRAKYEEMFAGLAAILDERGVSAEEVARFFSHVVYYGPETDWMLY